MSSIKCGELCTDHGLVTSLIIIPIITTNTNHDHDHQLAFFSYRKVRFVSEFLHFMSSESNVTLRTLLSTPPHGLKGKKDAKGKIQLISNEIVRPGYSAESQFACRHCGKRYRWKSTMRRHEQVECGGKEPSFQCQYCPYKAKQKGNLGVHIRKHHPQERDDTDRKEFITFDASNWCYIRKI